MSVTTIEQGFFAREVITPGVSVGPNVHSSVETKANLARVSNSPENAGKNYGMEVFCTIVEGAYKIHLAIPTSPYAPGAFVVWVESPHLIESLRGAQELSGLDWAQSITSISTELPDAIQQRYWQVLLWCLKRVSEYGDRLVNEGMIDEVDVVVVDNMLDLVATKEKETTRTLGIVHSHVVPIVNRSKLPLVDLTDQFTEVKRVKNHPLYARLLNVVQEHLVRWLDKSEIAYDTVSRIDGPKGIELCFHDTDKGLALVAQNIGAVMQWAQHFQSRFTALASTICQDKKLKEFIGAHTFKKAGLMVYVSANSQSDGKTSYSLHISPTFIGHKGTMEQWGIVPKRTQGKASHHFSPLFQELAAGLTVPE